MYVSLAAQALMTRVPFLRRESRASPRPRERDFCRIALIKAGARVYRLFPECGTTHVADGNSVSRFGTRNGAELSNAPYPRDSHGSLTDKAGGMTVSRDERSRAKA